MSVKRKLTVPVGRASIPGTIAPASAPLKPSRSGSSRTVVLLALELVRQVVGLEPTRVVVRVDVALPVAELAAVVAAVAERLRRLDGAELLDVRGRLLQGDVGRVRLGGAREVRRRLRQVEARFRQPHVLDRLRR